MAETKQKWLKTDKLGRKICKMKRKRVVQAMFCFCTLKLSNYFLPNCQFLFCQATQFCSAKLNIFAKGVQGPPGPPPKNAYGAFSGVGKTDCETDESFAALVLVLTWKSSLHPPHFSTQVLMNFTHPWDYF